MKKAVNQSTMMQRLENEKIWHQLNANVKSFVNCATSNYAHFLSKLIGEPINTNDAIHATHTIIAMIASVFPIGIPLTIRILLITWLGISIYQCRHIGD